MSVSSMKFSLTHIQISTNMFTLLISVLVFQSHLSLFSSLITLNRSRNNSHWKYTNILICLSLCSCLCENLAHDRRQQYPSSISIHQASVFDVPLPLSFRKKKFETQLFTFLFVIIRIHLDFHNGLIFLALTHRCTWFSFHVNSFALTLIFWPFSCFTFFKIVIV